MKILTKTSFIIFIILLSTTLTISAAQVHRVNPGDNLFKIAKSYNVTIEEIIHLNNLRNPNNIFASQVLIIPESEASYFYRVKTGDTLYKIAKKLDTSVKRLAETNYISPAAPLYIRQILYIPPKLKKYEIKKGDTLKKIADSFNIKLDNLLEENNFKKDAKIHPGNILIIPKPAKSKPKYNGPNYKKLFPETFFLKGNTGDYKITLTFDDGPDEVYTPQILDILKKYNIKATFFVIGNRIEKNSEIVKRMNDEGHIVANHSWSHKDLSQTSEVITDREINLTEDIIEKKTGKKTAYLRPPYGAVSEELLTKARNLGYKVIHWSVDSRDWSAMDIDQILINTLPNVRGDSILLFHSAGGRDHDLSATVNVLSEVIETLKISGYEFVNLDKLL